MPYKDPAKQRACSKKWRQNNPGAQAVYQKTYEEKIGPDRAKLQRRKKRIKCDYGLTLEQYEEMWIAQGGKCAICGKDSPSRLLCVDHDHETGKVRGLLCVHCNHLLGNARDKIQVLASAIQYLEGHHA
jgi:hypothetical protein